FRSEKYPPRHLSCDSTRRCVPLPGRSHSPEVAVAGAAPDPLERVAPFFAVREARFRAAQDAFPVPEVGDPSWPVLEVGCSHEPHTTRASLPGRDPVVVGVVIRVLVVAFPFAF